MHFKSIYACSFYIVLVVNICCWTQAEVFTAISDMEPLLDTHKRIIDDVEEYIALEEKRLATLKKRINLYKLEHDKAMKDIPNYLGNPINAFTLIKRLTTDLVLMREDIEKAAEQNARNTTKYHENVKYPSLEDLAGAAQALMRLQETYKLDIVELSKGMLNGVVYSTPMTIGDCYELGVALYNDENYEHALAWFYITLEKYEQESEPLYFSYTDVLEYISGTHFQLGNTKVAMELAKDILKMDRKHPRAASNIMLYQKKMAEDEAEEMIRQLTMETEDADPKEIPESEELVDDKFIIERNNYEMLCRGEMDVPPVVAKRLHCRYLNKNHPFLMLAPIKVEYMYLEPDIVVFHEVMSDAEIEVIQEMARPRFKRAMVHDPKTGEMVPVSYRISKAAWLRDEESEVVARVTQRVADMTGLSMDSAEELQVVNYGVGGHYIPHYDFYTKRDQLATSIQAGNRIATILFYMSDVAQGGATVFTILGLSLFPVKGAAAFWLNLHPSGEGDMATRHAACPVLRGSKWAIYFFPDTDYPDSIQNPGWKAPDALQTRTNAEKSGRWQLYFNSHKVSNKWIHQVGQELLRPCNLENQEEGIARELPEPVPKSSR